MKLAKEKERKLKSIVRKYLKKEGPSFDIPHTKLAVSWMKKLLKKERGNEKILVATMYLHDIGYHGLLKDNKNFDERVKAKPLHMKKGAVLAKKILKEMKGFSKEEIKKISELIKTHDNLNKKNNLNEQLVFEADSLAMIDKRSPCTISKKDHRRFLSIFKRKRAPQFKTESGKEFLRGF